MNFIKVYFCDLTVAFCERFLIKFSICVHPCDGILDLADLAGDSRRRRGVPPVGPEDPEVAPGDRVRDEAGAAPAGN